MLGMINKMDSRGWFSFGLFVLTIGIFAMLAYAPSLKDNQLFATLAQAVIITGLINMAAGFHFGASKSSETPPAAAPFPAAPAAPVVAAPAPLDPLPSSIDPQPRVSEV